jgi:hypothetical protein
VTGLSSTRDCLTVACSWTRSHMRFAYLAYSKQVCDAQLIWRALLGPGIPDMPGARKLHKTAAHFLQQNAAGGDRSTD